MQFNKGDIVTHIGFPEVTGLVEIIIPMPNNQYKLGVFLEDFNGGRIYYDTDENWEMDMYDPSEDKNYVYNDAYNIDNIVEVEYEVIE